MEGVSVTHPILFCQLPQLRKEKGLVGSSIGNFFVYFSLKWCITANSYSMDSPGPSQGRIAVTKIIVIL